MEFTNNYYNFMLGIALLKKSDLSRYVSAAIYHCTSLISISLTGSIIEFAFKRIR